MCSSSQFEMPAMNKSATSIGLGSVLTTPSKSSGSSNHVHHRHQELHCQALQHLVIHTPVAQQSPTMLPNWHLEPQTQGQSTPHDLTTSQAHSAVQSSSTCGNESGAFGSQQRQLSLYHLTKLTPRHRVLYQLRRQVHLRKDLL